jgi:glycosyltransferase involved in cell wall biosynthesis
VVDRANLGRKGLRPFVAAAALLPDVGFELIGKHADDGAAEELRREAGENVTLTGWVSDDELHAAYLRAAVYVQASAHEGFGVSVAEAMLAGCVPVATRVGALPEVVGEAGILIDDAQPDTIARAITEALALGPEAGAAARTRVLDNFPVEARKRGLDSLVGKALGG